MAGVQQPVFSDNAIRVLKNRYLLNAGGIMETPSQLFQRVSKSVASAELKWGTEKDAAKWEGKFYELMTQLLFLPNSPTLMNAGTALNQLSACFVLPVEDSISEIFTTLKHAAMIQQSGGGTGFNFSHLRPKNDPLTTTQGTASGPVSFMKVFNAATEHIKQGGKRRGANMGILDIDHPDIEEFISLKQEKDALNNFNISVGITDAFMNAVERNENWDFIHPNNNAIIKTIPAKNLWNNIVEHAWLTGDPGLIFIDTINHDNPTPLLGKLESTNPCGEVPLLPYEPCNLGSINLSRIIKREHGKNEIDWEKLKTVTNTAVRFLDNVVEINNYLLPEIKAMAMGNRKTGLGIMGWADLLLLLEMPYDSDAAVQLGEQLMSFICSSAREASKILADERGVFPNWKKSRYFPDTKVRNATVTSIAPTGTISILANTSSSIEPLFALAFQRRHVLNEDTLFSINEIFVNYLRIHQLHTEKIIDQVTRDGTAGEIKELPEQVKRLFRTALEISPKWHLEHQLAFQKHTDNAVSKTINLPENATIKDVEEIYRNAWQKKAKGITIYRYNSKNTQVIHSGLKSAAVACKVCHG